MAARRLAITLALVSSTALTACQTSNGQLLGAGAGAGVGALIGNQFGSGTGQVVATLIGAGVGALVGSQIASMLSEQDQERHNQATAAALEESRTDRVATKSWRNPETGARGTVEVVQAPPRETPPQNNTGGQTTAAVESECRIIVHSVSNNGNSEQLQQEVCRNENGVWEEV